MKITMLSILMLALLNTSYSQSTELYKTKLKVNEQGIVTFDSVIQVNGATKDVLYSRAKEWFVTTYNSADAVLELDSKEGGKLIGKPINKIYLKSAGLTISVNMHYTIKAYFKDGRYKTVISNIMYEPTIGTKTPAERWILDDNLYKRNGNTRKMCKRYKIATLNSINDLLASLEKAMKKETSNTDDDW